jgi:hypothetical protein
MSEPNRRPDTGAENVVAFKRRQPVRPQPPKLTEEQADEERARTRTNLVGLIFAAILVLVGWLLVQKLGHNSKMEDCLMSGRTNCAPIETPNGDR